MQINLGIDATIVLVQIVDNVRDNPDFTAAQKDKAVKAMEDFIHAIRIPQKTTGSGAANPTTK